MRSNYDFIEITGVSGNKKFLINKSSIIFVTPADGSEEQHAVIMTKSGDRMNKILTKESYKDVTEEILWNGWYNNPAWAHEVCSGNDVGVKAPEEVTNG